MHTYDAEDDVADDVHEKEVYAHVYQGIGHTQVGEAFHEVLGLEAFEDGYVDAAAS